MSVIIQGSEEERISLRLIITETKRLPTVLTALAIHLPGFTLHNLRNEEGSWHAEIRDAPKASVQYVMMLLDRNRSEDFAPLH